MNAERRRHDRLTPGTPLKADCVEGILSVFGRGPAHPAESVIDLSEGGIRLTTHRPLRPGNVLRIVMGSGEGQVEAYGEVRWQTAAAGDPNLYEAGVEFFSTTAGQIENIRDLCRRLKAAPA